MSKKEFLVERGKRKEERDYSAASASADTVYRSNHHFSFLISHYSLKGISYFVAAVLTGVLSSGCSFKAHSGSADVLPEAPDYADSTQWYVTQRGGVADIFYVISTETGDYPLADGTLCHYADTHRDSLRLPMRGEMVGVDTLLSGRLNFFSPYYRQCSLQTFSNDSLTETRMPVAVDDVRSAFAYYLTYLNPQRPFVLAGFSQGAEIMLQLLREMDDKTFSRLIAAYAIGVNVSQPSGADTCRILPARGADDTGVTICYNSVRDTTCALWPGRSAMAINPVNWRTDAQPATLITEPSPLLPMTEQKRDTMTVALDPASRLLLVSGFTATDYVLPLIGKEGNYHTREIWLYRDQLRDNIQLRSRKFKK